MGDCKILHQDWPDELRILLYGFLLGYCFLGVSIVSDVFMGSIEVITSRRKQIMVETGQVITVVIWNETVANLTLMALGSSAPEILLAVTEILGNSMHAGVLGPATIVGSASFNLLMIIALCIFVIPKGETRKVSEMPVFFITTFFMFLAYGWLLVVVSVWTPDVVDIWESVVTLLFLPILVFVSYLADVGILMGDLGESMEVRSDDVCKICQFLGTEDKETAGAVRAAIAERPDLLKMMDAPSAEDIAELRIMVNRHTGLRKSRAVRRVEATRLLTGGKKINWEKSPAVEHTTRVFGLDRAAIQDVPLALPKGHGPAMVQFAVESQCMSEHLTSKRVMLTRSGDCSEKVLVTYGVQREPKRWQRRCSRASVRSGSSSNSLLRNSIVSRVSTLSISTVSSLRRTTVRQSSRMSQYDVSRAGTTTIEAGEEFGYIDVELPENVAFDGCESSQFRVILLSVMDADSDGESPCNVDIGPVKQTLIVMRSNDNYGRFGFPYTQLLFPGPRQMQTLQVVVQRKDSCAGTATCSFRTERLSAIPGFSYEHVEGKLEFEEGATEAVIEVNILPKTGVGNENDFLLILNDGDGAFFDPNTDGGASSEILTIEIGPPDLLSTHFGAKTLRWLDSQINFNEFRLGNEEYKEQFMSAFFCNGSLEEQREASSLDMAFHIFSLPWKLIFMFVPPPQYCNGWICFWNCLLFIAGVTYIIGDLAELFGCVVGMTDLVTAISIVALGTSMPDLFASWTAASQDPTADAAITNVTGSNCVNVFLGLGLPWSLGSIYWHVKEWDLDWADRYPDIAVLTDGRTMKFVVRSGDLGFAVGVFTFCSILAVSILLLRRRKAGGELGGPSRFKASSSLSLVMLWFTYVGLSGWWSLRQKKASSLESTVVFTVGGCFMLIPWCICMFIGVTLPRPQLSADAEAVIQESMRKSADEPLRASDEPLQLFITEAFSVERPSQQELENDTCSKKLSLTWSEAGMIRSESQCSQCSSFSSDPKEQSVVLRHQGGGSSESIDGLSIAIEELMFSGRSPPAMAIGRHMESV